MCRLTDGLNGGFLWDLHKCCTKTVGYFSYILENILASVLYLLIVDPVAKKNFV